MVRSFALHLLNYIPLWFVCCCSTPTIAVLGKQRLSLPDAQAIVNDLPLAERARFADEPRVFVWQHFEEDVLAHESKARQLTGSMRAQLANELAQEEPSDAEFRAVHDNHPKYRFNPARVEATVTTLSTGVSWTLVVTRNDVRWSRATVDALFGAKPGTKLGPLDGCSFVILRHLAEENRLDDVRSKLRMEAVQLHVQRQLPGAVRRLVSERVDIDMQVLKRLDFGVTRNNEVVPQPD